MARTFKKDIYSLGMIYTYLYSDYRKKFASIELLNNFYECIEQNLSDMNSDDIFMFGLDYLDVPFYYFEFDKTGKEYCVLKNNLNLESAILQYINSVPINHIIASLKFNSLSSLGFVDTCACVKLKNFVIDEKNAYDYTAYYSNKTLKNNKRVLKKEGNLTYIDFN